ncbi:MAG TPA: clostripain-related cysteine peptidase [Pyrinomonadaceae bacterium]|nr:clostripain-related cysteine peptidase [Pyrinomonadaceae bacterium]
MPDDNGKSESSKAADPKEWTLMFYFASDNPLAPSIVSQLKSIKDAGFHPDANVIARFDPHGSVTPTHVFEVNLVRKLKARGRSQVGPPRNSFVRNLVFDKLWEADKTARFRDGKQVVEARVRDRIAAVLAAGGGEGRGDDDATEVVYKPPPLPKPLTEEHGPEESLEHFLKFCRDEYPARRYMLFILGHGIAVGNDLFLFDENAFRVRQTPDVMPAAGAGGAARGGDNDGEKDGEKKGEEHRSSQALLLSALGGVLNRFSDEIKKKDSELVLVGFHSCSMSSLEVAYEIRNSARYMMASQGPAFVGSWPYRHILMRIFNGLNSELTVNDFEDPSGLVGELKRGEGPRSELFRDLLSAETVGGLSAHADGQAPPETLLQNLAQDLNRLLENEQMHEDARFGRGELAGARARIEGARGKRRRLSRADLRRLNRRLLAEAYPGVVSPHTKLDTRKILSKIFSYCLYNSLDYQLAGYSFDLALCDLGEVEKLMPPLRALTETLIAGLESDHGSLAQELILLAHWDAQSYWQENYTDLYDFCLRLYLRCREARPASVGSEAAPRLREIKRACYRMMKALSNDAVAGEAGPGREADPDLEGLGRDAGQGDAIVRSEFAGPAYQYSHGFSLFFPWAEPVASEMWDKHYEKYLLNEDMGADSWQKFLQTYFDATMRNTRAEEETEMGQDERTPSVEQDLLEVIATLIFDESGQLAKGGPKDSTGGPGKGGGNDPTGDDCGCPPIKNYPSATLWRRRRKDEKGGDALNGESLEKEKVPLSRGIVNEFKLTD